MKFRIRFLSVLLALSLTLGLLLGQAYAYSFNPVVDTITSAGDSRITEMLSALSLQSYSVITAEKAEEYISYFISDSCYAAVGGAAWPYTNERGYVSTVSDEVYTISGINGSGCFAYAKFVMNVVYGCTGEVLEAGEAAGSVTAAGLESFLRSYAQAGEQLRLGNIHSVTFICCTASGFYYMDYWGGYIRLHYTTFEAFASACNSATSYTRLVLYNAETAVNDPSLQTTADSQSSSETAAAESTLYISATNYPSGQMVQGNYFTLRGTVASNYTITEVTGTIYSETGEAVQVQTATPNSTSLSIVNSVLDNLRFATLEVGGYYLEYVATDSSGKTVVWTSDIFTVVNDVSTLTITAVDYPTGSMVAESFTLTGSVTSNYTLTSVSAYIYNLNGDTLYSAMVTSFSSGSFSIANSGIDNALPFGGLEVGGYYLVYEATDKSGAAASWTSEVFYIVAAGEETAADSSADESAQPTIRVGSYPFGDMQAEDCTLSGNITATEGVLSEVRALLYAADGTLLQSVSRSPETIAFLLEELLTAEETEETDAEETAEETEETDAEETAEETEETDAEEPAEGEGEEALTEESLEESTEESLEESTEESAADSSCAALDFSLLESGFYYLILEAEGSEGGSASWQSEVFALGEKTLYCDTQDADTWYYSYVYALSQVGIFSGIENGDEIWFYPNMELSRAQAVALFYRLYCNSLGTPELTGSLPFTDIQGGSWYEESLLWAYANGIVSGTSETTFEPERTITRQEMARLIYGYAQTYYEATAAEGEPLTDYTDGESVGDWALEAVNWCIEKGIFSSTSTTELCFAPTVSATRAQGAVLFYNMMKKLA